MPENNLVYAAPESQGVPTQALLKFLQELRENRLPVHSFMFLRHGKVVAEGYCPPFDAHRKHRMYSCSKSFTSVAIGMLITEGRLKLTDSVASIFPEYLPENPDEYTMTATIRDLLVMATHNEGNAYNFDTTNWTRDFFNYKKPKHMPGTVFHYDTAATTTLCAVVEKLTGMKMLEYMRPVLDELGISKDIWCVQTPEGRSWTGSGVLCTTRDFARFGQFCLNRGEWNGKQLVDREYMMEATTRQIDCDVADRSPTVEGYGYQFWMLRKGGFACCGMGGQFAFMHPDTDSVLITTGDNQGIGGADELIRQSYYRLLDELAEAELPAASPEKAAELELALQLYLPIPRGEKSSPVAEKVSGVTYQLEENDWGWKWMRLEFEQDKAVLHYEKRDGVHQLDLHIGHYGQTFFPDLYAGTRIGQLDKHYECVTNLAWERENSLIGRLYSVDDFLGNIYLQFTFVGDHLTAFFTKAAEDFFGDYRGYYVGHAVK